MTYGPDQTIEDFLSAAAAKQPVPGGGSLAALTGALAAAMGEMVLNYSVGKKSLAEHEARLREAVTQLNHARAMLLELMVEDQDAYQALSGLKKLEAGSPELADRPRLALACVNVPLSIAATGVAVLNLADKMVGIVNPWLLSDLAVSAELAMATVRCASYNVMVNLPELADDAARDKARQTMQSMLAHGVATVQRVIPAVQAKLKS